MDDWPPGVTPRAVAREARGDANTESRGRPCIETVGSARGVAVPMPPPARRPPANGDSGPPRRTTNPFLAVAVSRPPGTANCATRTPMPNRCRGSTVQHDQGSKNAPRCPNPLPKNRLANGRL
jgi:hypothetical protein